MNKEIMVEIDKVRKDAIYELLCDTGFCKTSKEKEEWKNKKRDSIVKLRKIGFNIFMSPIVLSKRIRHDKVRKEEKYYKDKVAHILSKKEHLVNNI